MPKKKPDLDALVTELDSALIEADETFTPDALRDQLDQGTARTHLMMTRAYLDLALGSFRLCKADLRRERQARKMVDDMRKAAREDGDS